MVVPEQGPEELAELARHFNEMTARLKEAETERTVFEQARRDLIMAVGHDLRTPLASVQVIMEALADGVVDDAATVQRYLDTARRDLGTLSRLVDDLFVLAQLDSGGVQLDRRPNSLTDLVSDTLESFSVRAEQQQVRLHGEALAGIPNLEFDATYVGRVLSNLVDNALRYTPPGGEVVLKTDAVDDGVEVQVRDSGSGDRRARPAARLRALLPRRGLAQPRARRRRAGAGDRQGRRRGPRGQRGGPRRAWGGHDLLVRATDVGSSDERRTWHFRRERGPLLLRRHWLLEAPAGRRPPATSRK